MPANLNQFHWWLLRFVCFGIALQISCASMRTWPKFDSTQKTVLKVDNQWANAARKKNVVKLDQILSDEFVETDCNGKLLTKKEILDAMALKRNHYRSPGADWYCTVRDDNTAIVTGVGVLTSDLSDFCLEVQFTHVYKRQDGMWRAVSSKIESVE